jgi:glycosyltransferase involved in cell wall biosynthesis
MRYKHQFSLAIVIPVHNGAGALASSLCKLSAFLDSAFSWTFEIILAENGSIDDTLEVALELGALHHSVKVIHLAERGRGRALKAAWNTCRCDILAYVDVDLSSDLNAIPKLITALARGEYDLATGSRLLEASLTRRSLKREVISRAYNLLVKMVFRTHFSDAQCGFKAITKQAATDLLPLVEDNEWFFDTELMVLAEKLGYRIFDLPVKWAENPRSTVNIWRTVLQDLSGIIRLRRSLSRKRRAARPPGGGVRQPGREPAFPPGAPSAGSSLSQRPRGG